jgi:outer membrane receptor for ferrienterochelin and colicin
MTTIDKNTRNTKTDLLPSVELVLRPLSTVRLHAAWGRTVHRPQLQQLAPYRHYDALSFLVTTGNPILANTVIDNYDAGLDWMPRAGTQISISGFYKRMDQPIENIVSPFSSSRGTMASTPNNTPPTDLRGLTASFKTNLEFIANAGWMKNLFLFAGGSWLDGTVPGGPVRSYGTPVVAEHTLSGSPDYTLNAGLVMQYPRWPMLTVLYNHIGDYISAVGSGARIHLANGNIVSVVPDYRIKARDQLDLQVAQKFYHSRIQLIAGVNNLANNAYVEYQDLNGNKKFDQPLSHTIKNNSGGYFNGGVDNTVLSTKPQRTYYLTVSYLFK